MAEDPLSALQNAIAAARRSAIGEPTERVVLLGAGASMEAGMPASSDIDAMLLGDRDLPIYYLISTGIGGRLRRPDFERYVRVLEYLAESDEPQSLATDLRSVGVAKDRQGVTAKGARAELRKIKATLRRRLWRHMSITQMLGREDESEPDSLAYLRPLISHSLGGTVATLNYDNCFELADPSHVRVVQPGRKRVLVPVEEPERVRLLKLHGSMNWRRVEDDVVGQANPLGVENYDPGIIFGAGNKLRHYGPYKALLRAFDECLLRARVVVTIGYSFGDPHITDALRVWAETPLEGGKNKTLTACFGPDTGELPPPVASWHKFEHVDVRLGPAPASAAISELFE